MIPKINAVCGVFLAMALQGLWASAQPVSPGTAPLFVLLPKNIQCKLDGTVIRPSIERSLRASKLEGSVGGLACWMGANPSALDVEIPLASTAITGGMLATERFGGLWIIRANSTNGVFSIEIRADKLPSLRTFLQKRQAEITAASHSLAELSARAWTLLQDANANPAELSQALDSVAKAGLLEKPNADGLTLLNKAAQLGRKAACEQLAQLGANPNSADAEGRSALSYAAATLPSLYDMLVAKGGNEGAPDADGRTPAEIAGRFTPWSALQGAVDETEMKSLLNASGPLNSIQARVKGEILVDSKNLFSVAADSASPAKISVAAIGGGNLRVSSETGVDSISGSDKCFMVCLLLPYGSKVDLGTSAYLFGKLFASGTLDLDHNGIRFTPSNSVPSNVTEDRTRVNSAANGTIDAGANFSGGSSFTFTSTAATTVTIDPSKASLGASQSLQFHATSTSSGHETILWSISPQLGRISPDGLYEAPPVIEQARQITITATSGLDPTKSASAIVTLASQ
jgi:hypothetical protein